MSTEVLEFKSSEEFMAWARDVVKRKAPEYNRAPIGKQTWLYGDGKTIESQAGKRGGTLLSNLSYTLSTATGKMDHSRDQTVVEDIDRRGGAKLTIHWPD